MDLKLKSLAWQCIPSFWVSLLALLFGMMLGWPSPSYPYLMSENSPVKINFDQSAMIAGFLMIGATVASPFASRYGCGTKYGIIICLALNLIGWIVVLFGNSIYNLLAGRLLVGIAFGYGQGQVKAYISEFCEDKVKQFNLKLFGLYIGLGVTLTFLIGIFVNYETLVLICTIISGVILFIALFLPHTPLEYVQFGKEKNAVTILVSVKMRGNVFFDVQALKARKEERDSGPTISSILKHRQTRKSFFLVCIMTFFQQFTGLPATFIYCELLFSTLNLSNADIFATSYVFLYVLVQGIIAFYFTHVNKKVMLLISSLFVTTSLILIVFVIHYEYFKKYSFICVIILYMFQFFHAIGLGSITPTLVQEYFPRKARNVVANYVLIVFCMSALLITKIFQVLFQAYPPEVPFILFFGLAILSFIFITIFLPYKPTVNE